MSFAKIFQTIYDSSIADDWKLRVVFQDMIVLADKNGIVDMTPTAISRRTNLPVEMILEAIPKLEGPDVTSKTPDKEGRRIERLDSHRDWGWRIINYERYRESATIEMIRLAEAVRKAAYRRKFQKKSLSHTLSKEKTSDIEAEAEAEESPTVPPMSRTVRDNSVERPSLEEVRARAQLIGLADWKAQDFFEEMDGCGWLDYNHRPVRNWQSVLNRVRTKWEADGRPTQPPTRNENTTRTNGASNRGSAKPDYSKGF